MPRVVTEWHGVSASSDLPPRVKLRILERDGWCCTGPCHRRFDEKLRPQFDHRPPLILGGQNRESQIFAVCAECHSIRTRLDVAAKAKTAKLQRSRAGIKKPSQFGNSRNGRWKTRVGGRTELRNPMNRNGGQHG